MQALNVEQLQTIGESLIQIRCRLRMSQCQFEKLLKLQRGTVNRYEARSYGQCSLDRLIEFYRIAQNELERVS
jgi:hypothetical protein